MRWAGQSPDGRALQISDTNYYIYAEAGLGLGTVWVNWLTMASVMCVLLLQWKQSHWSSVIIMS